MNFQEKLKEIRELAGLDENVKSILKQMTGKELVSYEGIDALVAALMEFYNKELKKKATTNHTHSKEQIEEFPVFGTGANEMLEGVKLAETLGIPYGGNLNNSNTKTEGTAYYDSTTKKTYKCTATNTLNYADASKYEAISNNDLLLKFQNLSNIKSIYSGDPTLQIKNQNLLDYSFVVINIKVLSKESTLPLIKGYPTKYYMDYNNGGDTTTIIWNEDTIKVTGDNQITQVIAIL